MGFFQYSIRDARAEEGGAMMELKPLLTFNTLLEMQKLYHTLFAGGVLTAFNTLLEMLPGEVPVGRA